MKIGLVVDGETEFAAIRCIYDALGAETGHQFIGPIKADIQPKAPVGVIVKKCLKAVAQHQARGAGSIIVLLDREDRDECPAELAQAIEAALHREGFDTCSVVIKNRTFENWVLADIAAVRACRGLFQVSNSTAKLVQPNKADNVQAMELLKRSRTGSNSYDKIKDGKAVMSTASVPGIAANSRSFRRFLRLIDWPAYARQSKTP